MKLEAQSCAQFVSQRIGPSKWSAPIASKGFSWSTRIGESIGIDSLLEGWAMPKAYSGEMRERVIAEVESGASRREAAEKFAVSAGTAVILGQVLFGRRAAAWPNRGAEASHHWRSMRIFCWV